MIVNGILVALAGVVILVTGAVILDIRVVLFGLVCLLGGGYAIYWSLKKSGDELLQAGEVAAATPLSRSFVLASLTGAPP